QTRLRPQGQEAWHGFEQQVVAFVAFARRQPPDDQKIPFSSAREELAIEIAGGRPLLEVQGEDVDSLEARIPDAGALHGVGGDGEPDRGAGKRRPAGWGERASGPVAPASARRRSQGRARQTSMP